MRFTFTQKFGSVPSDDEYNAIKDDFLTYINTSKLNADNLSDESIRFRHLSSPPVVSLFKDCGSAIWNAYSSITDIGRSGVWELYRDTSVIANNTLQLDYSTDSDSPGTELVEFTLWYYPYSIAMPSEVAPAIKISGTWQAMVEHRRAAGIGIGFYTPYEQLPYTPNPSSSTHPFVQYAPQTSTGTGNYDRAGTVAYGGPIICTVTLSKLDLANVESLGMMVKHDTSFDYPTSVPSTWNLARKVSECSVYDRLFLSLVARDN